MLTVAQAGQVFIQQLENGATAIIKERDDTQAVVIQVWFGVGSVFEKDNERGLSHFLEHMLFNGTKYTKPGEIERWVENKGGYINAGTSKDFTFYYIEIGNLFWEKSLEYLYYMTTAPLLTQEMIEKEKPIVLEELNRHLNSPISIMWDTFYMLAYKVSNYKYPVIGFRETIEKFDEPLVKNYFYSHYVPSNTYIVVVGNVEKDKVLKKLKETFGSVKGKYYKPPKVPLEPPQKEIRKKVVKKPQLTRAYAVIGWQAPSVSDRETFVATVLEEILTGGKTSILYRKLREEGLVYSIGGGYLPARGTGQFVFYYATDPQKLDTVKNIILNQLKDFRKNGVPEELVELAKKRIINREVFYREKVSDDAQALGYSASVVGNIDYSLKYEEYIKQVSKEDIDKYIKKYMKNTNYTQVYLLPEGK